MSTIAATSSTSNTAEAPASGVSVPSNPAPVVPPSPPPLPILADRWPALGHALNRYAQGTAETFSRMAYDAVDSGLIRHSDRQRLAHAAEELGIRSFDAQLLIACAIRQWAIDRRYEARPSRRAPALSFEYRAWRRSWVRIGLIVGTAVALDGIILWKWLGL